MLSGHWRARLIISWGKSTTTEVLASWSIRCLSGSWIHISKPMSSRLEAKAFVLYNHGLGSSYTVVIPARKDGCCREAEIGILVTWWTALGSWSCMSAQVGRTLKALSPTAKGKHKLETKFWGWGTLCAGWTSSYTGTFTVLSEAF
jgi:hypothetical protein